MTSTVRAAIIALAGAALAACSSAPPDSGEPSTASPAESIDIAAEAIERGRRLTLTACAGCHATGPAGASPLTEATPLREIVRRHPLERLEAGFAEGLVTAHPAMPAYVFRASEIDDLIAYLETLKAEG